MMTTVKSDLELVLDILTSMKESYDNPGTYESREYYERMDAKASAIEDAIDSIKYQFGVK